MWSECRLLFKHPSHIHVEEKIWGTRPNAEGMPKSPSSFEMNLARTFKNLDDSADGKFAIYLLVSQVSSLDGKERLVHTNVLVVRYKDAKRSCKL